eukprot:4417878-Amphidinium_carterae.2
MTRDAASGQFATGLMDARKALPETNATSHTQESGMRLQHSTRLGRGRSKHEWPPWRKRCPGIRDVMWKPIED